MIICLAVSTQYRRVTDSKTSCDSIVGAMHMHRAVKTGYKMWTSNSGEWRHHQAMGNWSTCPLRLCKIVEWIEYIVRMYKHHKYNCQRHTGQ